MRSYLTRHLAVLVVIAGLGGVTACSSEDTKASSKASSSVASPTTTGKKSDSSPPSSTKAPGKDGAKDDCEALKLAAGKTSVKWQVIIGLARRTDVSTWERSAKVVGDFSDFGPQLDTLNDALSSDKEAAEAIDLMRQADVLVRKGIGGDESAGPALVTLLGTDTSALVQRQAAIAKAIGDLGC